MDGAHGVFRDLRLEELDGLKARDRILKTAIGLFNAQGVHTTGVDQLIAESRVSKRTFYSHFPSKWDLVGVYLAFWDGYRRASLQAHLEAAQDGGARAQLLAVFDAVALWTKEADFNGCVFTRGLSDFHAAEYGALAGMVQAHFKESSIVIGGLLTEIAGPERAKVLLPQVLSLIVGSMAVAHMSGDAGVVGVNKRLVEGMIEGGA